MRRMTMTAVLAVTMGLAGCMAARQQVMGGPGESWDADLAPQSGTTVRGQVDANSENARTTARISIEGAPAGGQHPWHIHRGRCGSNGPIMGDPSAYPLLRPGSDGRASATATIAVNLNAQPDDEFYVNVHLSPQQLGTIVSCGQLEE